MGFELDRLMRQYGVSTPSIASYSGTLYPGAYADVVGSKDGQLTPQQYQESLRQYNLDRGVYDKYAQDYQRRVRETPMYLQEQFQPGRSTAAPITTFSPAQTAAVRGTVPGVNMDEMNRKIRDWFAANPNATPAEVRAAQNEWGVSDLDIRNAVGLQRPRSAAYRSATGPGGVGLDAMNANIRKYFGENPFSGDQAIAAEQDRWGLSNEDLYRGMGSYWGNQLGSPTYSNFDPTIAAMTPQQKAAYYNRQLAAGYSDADIRKSVERSVGPQADEAWSYLRNLAGGNAPAPTPAPTPAPAPGAGPAPAPTPAPREPTDRRQPLGVNPPSVTPQSSAAAQFAKIGKVMPANWETTTDPLERIRILNNMGVTSDQLKSIGYSPADIAWMEARGFGQGSTTATTSGTAQQGAMPQAQAGEARVSGATTGQAGATQTPEQAPTAQADAAQGIASLAQEDPFVAAIKQAAATPQAQTPIYKDPKSESTLSVKKDYLGQPLEFTFTDKYGKSETVGASNTTPINELAQKYGIDLTGAFGAGTSSAGGGLPWYGTQENAADTQKYANVGSFTPGAPQQMVYSPEDQGLVFQPIQAGQDLGTQVSEFAAKPFAELENTLQQFKQTPPKTQEELVAANSAWLDYQNRFANSSVATQPGRYDSSLKPISMLAQTYNEYGPLNQTMTSLSQQASEGTSQALTGSPFAGGQAQQLNQTIAALGANPLVQQTLDKISSVDPSAKFSTDDATRLAGQIQELGAENAISNFIKDKQNLIGFGTNNWQSRLNVQDPTYAAYQNMLNNIGGLYAQPAKGLARGGAVNAPRRFQVGGLNDVDRDKDFATLAEEYGAQPPAEPAAQLLAAQPPAAQQPMDLQSMLARYMQPGASSYGAELAQARQRAQTETEAFNKMLQDAIKGSGEGGGPSKSEMYFRLAAAFADPGKTGSFGEGLGRAAGAMAEQKKAERESRRAAARERLQLGLTAQQARMTGAREDVSSLRQLAGEEMKDKRTITAELLKDWTKRNDPVSTAGKQAQDEGLKPGTPQFQARVREISELAVDKANAQIQASVAGMSVAAANLALGQARFTQQQAEAKRLTPQELTLKTDTENAVAAADSAMRSLKQAYQLNPNSFDASLPDLAQRKMLEAVGSKDTKLVNTRTMENLLGEQALSQLKTTFGSAPTEGERKILMDLQGIGAKSREERAIIMRNAFKSLQSARERQQKRLNEINQGLYRDVGTPTAGGLE